MSQSQYKRNSKLSQNQTPSQSQKKLSPPPKKPILKKCLVLTCSPPKLWRMRSPKQLKLRSHKKKKLHHLQMTTKRTVMTAMTRKNNKLPKSKLLSAKTVSPSVSKAAKAELQA